MPSYTLSSTTPRSKRSTTNLANLRLAPLSEKFSSLDTDTPSTVTADDDAFAKLSASHRSAPTSPRALSRSSSGRRFLGGGGGISRRSSLYSGDGVEGDGFGYTGGMEDETRVSGERLGVSSGRVPKAKSEAALGVPAAQQQQRQRQRLAGKGERVKRRSGLYDGYSSSRSPALSRSARASGTTTPRVRVEDDWLTRTGHAASSVLQEQKGQSFLSSRHAALGMGTERGDFSDDDEDEDEGYEELAALSASRSGFTADDELSPVSTRASRWGSRYGSRRTSRRGSIVLASGSRTPLASAQAHPAAGGGQEGGYFDPVALPVEPDFIDDEEGGSSTDDEQRGMLGARFSSLGGLVDRLIGMRLFDVDEGRETSTESETEGEGDGETEGEAKKRIDAEVKRRREEKERLRDAQEKWRFGMGGEGEGAGWEDARWLFGRAREAWM